MIQKGKINEDVLYLIINRDSIGSHSAYIFREARGCRLLGLSAPPQEKDEISFDPEYAQYIDQIIKEVDWETQVLFIIVCNEVTPFNEVVAPPKEEKPADDFFGYFPWRNPVMKPRTLKRIQSNAEIMSNPDFGNTRPLDFSVDTYKVNRMNRICKFLERIFS